MSTEPTTPELWATVARLCDCLAEAVTFAQATSPGTGHNAGLWAAAVTEALAELEQARRAAATVAAAFEQEAEDTGNPAARADAERWRKRAGAGTA